MLNQKINRKLVPRIENSRRTGVQAIRRRCVTSPRII